MQDLKTNRLAIAHKAMLRGSTLESSGNARVRKALEIMDTERVSSVTSLVKSYEQKRDSVMADKDLSDSGKQARIRAAAATTMGNISTAAKTIARLEREHAQARANAVQLPATDAVQVQIDLALAAMVRQQSPTPTALELASERVRVAIARLPAELSGIDAATHAKVLGSLTSSEVAADLHEEAQALELARSTVQASLDDLASVADLEPREVVQLYGSDWRIHAVPTSMAQRLERELADEAAEADSTAITDEAQADA